MAITTKYTCDICGKESHHTSDIFRRRGHFHTTKDHIGQFKFAHNVPDLGEVIIHACFKCLNKKGWYEDVVIAKSKNDGLEKVREIVKELFIDFAKNLETDN